MYFTIGFVAFIIGSFIASWIYISRCAKTGKLATKQTWINQLPALISTLGVLGTFAGITLGLLDFNTNPNLLSKSILNLLDGLKMAFFTSLTGMICSLILSKVVAKVYEMQGDSFSTEEVSVGTITTAVDKLTKTMNDNASTLNTTLERLISITEESNEELNTTMVDNRKKTNELLEDRFDEFSQLLQKSNTEALVEVMKTVTEEFQKQMNMLISQLVNENFSALIDSVERLNTWQQENKEMISRLTSQYMEMTERFEQTSTVLTEVGKGTQDLLSEEGKLQRIISALNAVMVQDEQFIKITNNLTEAAELNKDSMTEFKDAQSALNEWVRKQRDFVETVQALMAQLEEISKINDYSETFWKETKKGMNDGVNAIKQGSKDLYNQIDSIDTAFYNRLNQTLTDLDNCIQKMVEHYEKH